MTPIVQPEWGMDDWSDMLPDAEALAAIDVERPPLLNGPKRQHFLPRFYLDGFTRDGLLAVFDRDQNEVRIQKPESTGVIGHFYTVEDEQGRKRFELEQVLSEIESKAAPIIKKLAAQEGISDDERSEMAMFVALGMCRTPDLVDSIKEMNGQIIKRMATVMFSDVNRVKAMLRDKPDSLTSEEALEADAKAMVEFAASDAYKVETHHGWALSMAMTMFTTIAPILAGRDWLVVHRNCEKRSFVTSDAPLVLTKVMPRKDKIWGIGFANTDALVLFPLTQSCALLIFGNDGGFVHKTVSQDSVKHFNLMVADRCQRFVVGRDETLVRSLAKRLSLAAKKWQPKMRAG